MERNQSGDVRKHVSGVGPKVYNCILHGPGWDTKYLLHNIIAREASMCAVKGLEKVAKADA